MSKIGYLFSRNNENTWVQKRKSKLPGQPACPVSFFEYTGDYPFNYCFLHILTARRPKLKTHLNMLSNTCRIRASAPILHGLQRAQDYSSIGVATTSCSTLTASSTVFTSFTSILRRLFCSRRSQRRVYFII